MAALASGQADQLAALNRLPSVVAATQGISSENLYQWAAGWALLFRLKTAAAETPARPDLTLRAV